jgi:dynein heavy chain
VLVVYINQFFCDAALNNPKYHLSTSDKYFIPEDGNSREHYLKYINMLPNSDADPPEAFGQHSNADIASQMEETKTLLNTVLSLQPRQTSGGGSGKTIEERVLDLIQQLQDQVPQPLPSKQLRKKYEFDQSPLTVVLLQEIDRYNVLLSKIHSTLVQLSKGIQGLVVISSALEEMFNSLSDAKVPSMWGFAYPSLKALGTWTRDLIQRIAQFTTWIDAGPPKVFWLSGFTFPTGFLTALLQNSARKNQVSIDSLGWDFVVMTSNEQSLGVVPKEGAYIKGMFLEGARWDMDAGVLCEPLPMELVVSMPIIHFKPIEARKKAGKGLYSCPCYMYPVRTGSRERPSFMLEVDLKSGSKPAEYWTKRGTALLLSLDS